jgi:hypothetical protein
VVQRQAEQGRRSGQALAPEVEAVVEDLSLEPLALPEGVVGVLHGQIRQPGPLREAAGRVESGQLADQHPHGPAVGNDVVHGEEERVLGPADLHQQRVEQRSGLQVERTQGLGFQEVARGGLPEALRQTREVGHRQQPGARRIDHLDRPAVVDREAGAEALLAGGQGVDRPRQGGGVEGPGEVRHGPHVVGRRPRLELLDEPEALLGEGERQAGGGGARQQGRGLAGGLGAQQSGEARRQLGDGRRVEQPAQRDLDAEHGAQPRDRLDGDQRAASQLEEVFVASHAIRPEDLAPDRGQGLLHRIARCGGLLHRPLGPQVALGEGAAVHLPHRGERKLGEELEDRRDHVRGQALGQEGTDAGEPGRGVGDRPADGQEGGEPLAAGQVVAHRHGRVADLRVRGERSFDLAGLDAEAADLDLVVHPAEKAERSVQPPGGAVAGAVEALPGLAGERIGDEALGREVRPVQVATGQAVASGDQLSGDARGHRSEGGVHDVDPRAGDRLPDGERHPGLDRWTDDVRGGVGGVLGRPVVVAQPHPGLDLQDALSGLGEEHVAADREDLHPAQDLRPGGRDLVEVAWRDLHGGDAVPLDDAPQLVVGEQPRRRHDQAAPVEQGAPDLQGRGVERDRRVFQEDLVGRVLAEHQASDAAVLDADRLGLAGGAGGEHHVGEPRRDLRGRLRALAADRLRLSGEAEGAGARKRQIREPRRLGQDQRHARLLHHQGQALARIVEVERHVGAAGFENGEEDEDAVQRALQRHADQGF